MNDYSRLSCLCLAAGRSSRMGEDHKLLKILGQTKKTVIEHVVSQLVTIPFAEIIVVTGARGAELREVLRGYPVRFVANEDYAKGLHSSIRAGVKAMGNSAGFLICLGDQPFSLRERILSFRTVEWDSSSLIRSTVNGSPGHPVLIGADYKSEILQAPDQDSGAAYLFRAYKNKCETLEQPEAALWDLDTPEDFARYSALIDGHQG